MVVGGWMLDFTKLMQSHLPTKVEVEVEDELGNIFRNVGNFWIGLSWLSLT